MKIKTLTKKKNCEASCLLVKRRKFLLINELIWNFFNLLLFRVMSFGEECLYREYPDMLHGWTVRGDNRKEDVSNAAKAAFNSMLGFLCTHLK